MLLLAVLSARRTELRLAEPDGGQGLSYVSSYISDSLDDADERAGAIGDFLERERCTPDSAAVARPSEGDRIDESALRALTATDRLLVATPAEAMATSVTGGCLADGSEDLRRVVIYTDGELDCAVIPAGGGRPFDCPIAAADPVYASPVQLDFHCFVSRRLGRPRVGEILTDGGMELMYAYLRDGVGYHEPAWMARSVREEGVSAAVQACVRSTERSCRLARMTAELLASLLRTEALNTAIRSSANGGAVLSGSLVRTAAAVSGPEWPRRGNDNGHLPKELRPYLPVLASESCTRMDGLSRMAERELAA
jgi:hypothetical protein